MSARKELAVLRAARKWFAARHEYLFKGGDKKHREFVLAEINLSAAVRELQEERNRET